MEKKPRSFDELAATLYPRPGQRRPAPEPEEQREEETTDQGSTESTAPISPPADVVRELVGEDDRLMKFLEQDIAALDNEYEEDQEKIRRNMESED